MTPGIGSLSGTGSGEFCNAPSGDKSEFNGGMRCTDL